MVMRSKHNVGTISTHDMANPQKPKLTLDIGKKTKKTKEVNYMFFE
jgi:hypothetical protein